MNSRERIKMAIEHKEPDRIPFDLGGTILTSITKNAYINLCTFLGINTEKLKILNPVEQLPFINEILFEKLGADVRPVETVEKIRHFKLENQEILQDNGYYYFFDRWGAKLVMPMQDGQYFDWGKFPINDIDMKLLDEYRWPEPDPKESFESLKECAKKIYAEGEYAIAGTAIFGGGIFEQPGRMMGMDKFLLSLALDPQFADTMLEKVTELYIENCNRYLDKVGKFLDIFVYWDDITGQRGPLISPEMYRKYIKPKEKRLIEAIKKKTDAKIFYHCCGAVTSFIPDFIDMGIDILNPIQVSAQGMDTLLLKKEFGNELCFWGGGCDTQHTLPHGSPEEIRDEVKKRIDDLAPGGGFVFSAIHNIQDDVPPENIMAMVETLFEYGKYK